MMCPHHLRRGWVRRRDTRQGINVDVRQSHTREPMGRVIPQGTTGHQCVARSEQVVEPVNTAGRTRPRLREQGSVEARHNPAAPNHWPVAQ